MNRRRFVAMLAASGGATACQTASGPAPSPALKQQPVTRQTRQQVEADQQSALDRSYLAALSGMRAMAKFDRYGYDLKKAALSEDLKYGNEVIQLRVSHRPYTDCVWAVYEFTIRSLHHYQFVELPALRMKSDQHAKLSQVEFPVDFLRGKKGEHPFLCLGNWLWQWELQDKNWRVLAVPGTSGGRPLGAADGFPLFGIGKSINFREARLGDLVYTNRWYMKNGKRKEGGHSVVFLSFLERTNTTLMRETSTFGPDVIGFRFFTSNQGVAGTADADGGFGEKFAIFDGTPNAERLLLETASGPQAVRLHRNVYRETPRTNLLTLGRIIPSVRWDLSVGTRVSSYLDAKVPIRDIQDEFLALSEGASGLSGASGRSYTKEELVERQKAEDEARTAFDYELKESPRPDLDDGDD